MCKPETEGGPGGGQVTGPAFLIKRGSNINLVVLA